MKKEKIRLRDHSPEELVFYSKATTDIEFKFPFGWGELWGIADRTDYDLTQHMNHSKQDLSYQDPETNEKYVPYVIEPSLGADRVVLAFLCNAYDEEEITEEELIRRIIEYKSYKEITKKLKENFIQYSKRFYKTAEEIKLPKQKIEKKKYIAE